MQAVISYKSAFFGKLPWNTVVWINASMNCTYKVKFWLLSSKKILVVYTVCQQVSPKENLNFSGAPSFVRAINFKFSFTLLKFVRNKIVKSNQTNSFKRFFLLINVFLEMLILNIWRWKTNANKYLRMNGMKPSSSSGSQSSFIKPLASSLVNFSPAQMKKHYWFW